MSGYPFISPRVALVLLRVCTAGFLMAHAVTRVFNGTIPRFGGFLGDKGLPLGVATVWGITALELVGGAVMAAGYFVRTISTALFAMLAVGIVLIHAQQGWWVGEHGQGGVEYSAALMVALVVVCAVAPRKNAESTYQSS